MAEKDAAHWTRIGRIADYFFGRNALIGIASLMLLLISAYATWRDLGAGLSASNDFLVGAITVALIFLMWLALRETFGAKRRWSERLITGPLYLFLALWSIGFGSGFGWSLIAGEEATRTSLAGLQEDARDASGVVSARLDAVKTQVGTGGQWS